MVYCSKCGGQNPDNSNNCFNCGTSLNLQQRPYSRQEWRRQYNREGYSYRSRGSGFGLLIAGLFILLIGLASLTSSWTVFWQYFWPTIFVIVGIWLLLSGIRRNRRLNSRNSNN